MTFTVWGQAWNANKKFTIRVWIAFIFFLHKNSNKKKSPKRWIKVNNKPTFNNSTNPIKLIRNELLKAIHKILMYYTRDNKKKEKKWKEREKKNVIKKITHLGGHTHRGCV